MFQSNSNDMKRLSGNTPYFNIFEHIFILNGTHKAVDKQNKCN